MIGWPKHTGMALGITTSVKTIRRFWMRLRPIPPIPFLIWAVGLDGSKEFVAMARSYSGCEVLHQDFLAMVLPQSRFDGVFANASLFHVPSQELPRILLELRETLRPRGVLFCSNPRGTTRKALAMAAIAAFSISTLGAITLELP